MAPFEAFYSRCTYLVCFFEVGEIALNGPKLVYEAIERVQHITERSKTTKSLHNSYANVRRKDLEFEVSN